MNVKDWIWGYFWKKEKKKTGFDVGTSVFEIVLQLDGNSHVIYAEEEAAGTRLLIDGRTCLLQVSELIAFPYLCHL